jgi:hypothetical protein
MKCPYCDQTLPFSLCPECGGETPERGLYCCHCGKPMRGEESVPELSERIPCRDGSCIGTINEQGVCNECGKRYAADPT